jgi:hypothetical protein
MATHDYVIDNQSATAFRSDLNGVLQAIVTQNSSSTVPTTTYPNMIWYNTDDNLLRKRNEANSGWINLGTIDEVAGTFTPSGLPPTQTQATWTTGTSTTESLISPAKLDDKIGKKLNLLGSAPMYACRAWVNFNGTGTVAIRASGNVSSITDNGTGDYTVNFTTAMPDADYSITAAAGAGGNRGFIRVVQGGMVAGSCRILFTDVSGGEFDQALMNVAIFR